MRLILSFLFILLLASSSLFAQDQKPKLISWQDIASLPAPAPGMRVAYGPDSLQYGELRLPEGKGSFPVIILVHGGCWLAQYNLAYMAHLSDALTKAGYATWNLEFKRVGDAGGGYPGTFLDVAKGADHVKELAKQFPLDKKRVVVMGHSAGGHLALWLAGRRNLSRKSELYTRRPLKVKGVIALAGITDLEIYATEKGSCNAAVPKLLGGMPAEVPTHYTQTSPMHLLPLKVPQRLIQGALDPIVPTTQAENYMALAKSKKDDAEVILLPDAGHFDLVAPQSPVWATILETVKSILK